MSEIPSPAWRPSIVTDIEWVAERLRSLLPGKHFSLFENGSCVVWQSSAPPNEKEAIARIRAVVNHHPDFKVRRHASGDFLVTFRGGVGGIMSSQMLRENIDLLRVEAMTLGKISSEEFQVEEAESADDLDLIAGLYVRALLYLDVRSPSIIMHQ